MGGYEIQGYIGVYQCVVSVVYFNVIDLLNIYRSICKQVLLALFNKQKFNTTAYLRRFCSGQTSYEKPKQN